MKKTHLALAVAVVAAVGASLFNSASADYQLVCDGESAATFDLIRKDSGAGPVSKIENLQWKSDQSQRTPVERDGSIRDIEPSGDQVVE